MTELERIAALEEQVDKLLKSVEALRCAMSEMHQRTIGLMPVGAGYVHLGGPLNR